MSQSFNEQQLLLQLKDGATRAVAFEQIVARYSQRIYWQIRHMVVFHDDANDVLQNTFLKAWTSIDSFRGEARLSTWLYRIAANESLSFLQKQRDNVPLDNPDDNLYNTLESDTYFDGDETELHLQQALSQLPPKQKQVFVMKYYDGLKYEQMSEILETSVGALKASYHIATKKIEEYFETLD